MGSSYSSGWADDMTLHAECPRNGAEIVSRLDPKETLRFETNCLVVVPHLTNLVVDGSVVIVDHELDALVELDDDTAEHIEKRQSVSYIGTKYMHFVRDRPVT